SYPPYFLRLRERNRVGPELLGRDWKVLPLLSPDHVHQHLAGGGLVVDARPVTAFAAGHIPGALSVPLEDLQDHLARLKALKKPIVTYCA
ncbi:MAG: MBL fold metallo-hydrolase, partial [Acidobacteria bacterium]